MNISVILAHPKFGSFNHAIGHTVVSKLENRGHHVFFHDLYQEEFSPLFTAPELGNAEPGDELTAQYIDEIVRSEGLVLIHPNWWNQPPAALKGWVDRVLRHGLEINIPNAAVFTTANVAPSEPHLLRMIWQQATLPYIGAKSVYYKEFYSVVRSSPEEREGWLTEVEIGLDLSFG
ncbi:MAG TPA: NAD(P)H-dependent oxidoreductase [Bacillota bacterium]|nr:NAD(P)H-dependent oxidoreductase [Bacillota bacterium]